MKKKSIDFKSFEIVKVAQAQIKGGQLDTSAPDCSNGGKRVYPAACDNLS